MGSNLFDLDGRLALVTGSSRGIGHALARGLGEHGARIVVNGRDAEKVGEVMESFRSAGFDALSAPFDVTNSAAVEEAVRMGQVGLHEEEILEAVVVRMVEEAHARDINLNKSVF